MDLRAARDATFVKDPGLVARRELAAFGRLSTINRYAFPLQVLVYLAGFGVSWAWAGLVRPQRVWLELPGMLSRTFGTDLNRSIVVTTAVAIVLSVAGAVLRTWGSARRDRVKGPEAHRVSRRERASTPLWTGTILHTLALCILMSWAGAAFTLLSTLGLQAMLATRGSFSTKRDAPVQVLPSGPKVLWRRALFQEVYFWGAAISFTAFGWTYNAMPILQGLLVSLGLSIVVRALVNEH